MRLISKAYILHINKSKDHIDILLRECIAHHPHRHMVYQEWSIAQQEGYMADKEWYIDP